MIQFKANEKTKIKNDLFSNFVGLCTFNSRIGMLSSKNGFSKSSDFILWIRVKINNWVLVQF